MTGSYGRKSWDKSFKTQLTNNCTLKQFWRARLLALCYMTNKLLNLADFICSVGTG